MPADLPLDPGHSPSPRGHTTSPLHLAQELSRVVDRALLTEQHTPTMLDELAVHAGRLVPGADGASIRLLSQHHQVSFGDASDTLPAMLDAIQAETGDGPSLDAVSAEQPVRVPDLQHEQRWPRFVSHALKTGTGSMLSVPLVAGGSSLGALTLCSRRPGAFNDDSEHVALLFASHAAVAIAVAQKTDGLRVALTGRDLIGQAKGILMERYNIDADHAFAVLVRASQTEHRKLRDLAHELATSRNLTTLKDLTS